LRVHHHLHQLLEACPGFPSELPYCAFRISHELPDVDGTHQRRVRLHPFLPIQPGIGKGQVEELADGVRLPGRENVVLGRFLLEHQPDPANEIAGEPPVPSRVDVSEPELFLAAQGDFGHGTCDLLGDEIFLAPR
jgi:hypothetical protein